jgi:hypothetical protein
LRWFLELEVSCIWELKLGEFMMAWMRNMHVMLEIEALQLYLSRRRPARWQKQTCFVKMDLNELGELIRGLIS